MAHCPTCDGFYFHDAPHRCPPAWECRDPTWGDWRTVHAHTPEEAAERYAERKNNESCEWPGTSTIEVRRPGSDAAEVYEVTCEAVPQYDARKKEADRA